MVALKVGVAPSHPTTTATTAATITTRSAQDTESFVLGVRGLSRYACVEARLCVQMHVICETFSSARPYRENVMLRRYSHPSEAKLGELLMAAGVTQNSSTPSFSSKWPFCFACNATTFIY